MALNAQVAAILQQAVARRRDIQAAVIAADPDTTDHTETKIVYNVRLKGADKPLEGGFKVDQNLRQTTARKLFDKIIGPETLPEGFEESDERKLYLDTVINRLMEM